MSLRVNLIDPEEKRSGSIFNLRTLTRVSKIIVPVIILFIIALQIFNNMMTSSQMRMLQSRWEITEPKQKHAKELSNTLNYNLATWQELIDWKESRIDWNTQLQALIETTPHSIQLTSVIITTELIQDTPPSPPVRHFLMTIDGKSSGEGAMDYIEIFKNSIGHHKDVEEIINQVEVTNFEADPAEDAGELDRIFQVECDYKVRPDQQEDQPKK